MKQILLLSLVICCGFLMPVKAQVTFQSTFGTTTVGDNIPYDITPTNDDGFAITGFSSAGDNLFQAVLIAKTNEMGEPQWTKIIGGTSFEVGNSIVQTSDNGFLIGGRSASFGSNPDAVLFKTDALGNLQWTKTYGGNSTDAANSVFTNSNGTYTFIGETNSFSPSNSRNDVFIVNTTSTGTVNWSKTYNLNLNVDRVSGVMLPNGGYAFTGIAEFSAGDLKKQNNPSKEQDIDEAQTIQKPWLKSSGGGGGAQAGIVMVETDASGNILTEKLYTITGGVDCFGTSIILAQDGGYLIGGYTIEVVGTSFNYHITALKTNSAGTVQWSRNFQAFDSFFDVKVAQLENGNFVVTGTNSLDPGTDSRMTNYFLNEDGTSIETHEYGVTGLNAARASIPNSNGVLTVGQSNSFGMSASNSLEAYLVQTDGFGASGCNDLSVLPVDATYTYNNTSISFTTQNNGIGLPASAQSETLTAENNSLCTFTPPVTGVIEGFVWWDRNKDGIQQSNEGGLENIMVNLHNADDFTMVANTFTESDGTYTFEVTNTTFDYYIVFGTAPLYLSSTPNAGSNAALNSDITGSIEAGSTDVFGIEADETVEIDGGLLGAGSISGVVWKDDNSDGIFGGETGADGVTLLLTFNNNNFTNIPFNATTENGGMYKFDNLLVGEAVVEIADIQGTIIDGGTLTTANNPSNPFSINMNQLSVENINFGFNVPVCNIQILSAIPSDCNIDTDTYDLAVTVVYENQPSGDINITVLGNPTAFAVNGSGQQTFDLTLNSNGFQNVGVSADFASNSDCSDNLGATYDAPESCDLPCRIEIGEVTVGNCNPNTNVYEVEVSVEYEGEPDGDINIEILGETSTFAGDGSGNQTFNIELTANGFENIGVSASFANESDCGDNLGATFDAPEACDVNCTLEVTGVNVGDCSPATNSYDLEIMVTYADAPDGLLNIEVLGSTFSFMPDGSGEETFNISTPTSETDNVNVTAVFVENPNCSSTLEDAYNEPAACTPAQCSLDITDVSIGDCDPLTNTYTLEVTVVYTDAPEGDLKMDILGAEYTFTPDGSGEETFNITTTSTETQNVNVTAAFEDNANCSDTLENAYDEPASCEPQCSLEITDIFVSDCNETTNGYILEISVAYDNAPDGDIIISLLGQDFNIPSNGSGVETYSLEFPSVGVQNVEVSAAFDNDSDCSTTLMDAYDEPEPCVSDCPTSMTPTASDEEVCSGESISLKAVIDNLNFVLVWTDESGNTFDHDNVLLVNETCAPIIRTFTAKVVCSINSSIKFEDSIDITVYPSDIGAFITPVEGGCIGTVTIDESCGDNVTVKPFEAEAGASGIGFVIVNWIGGGDCIDKLTIPVAYDCDGVIEAVNDNLGTFSIGETVTFHPSQILANDSGNGLSVVEICTTSTNGGTIEDNGNDTYTYTPPSPNFVGTDTFCYTITDAEGNTDEAFVSVVYGDLKFVAEIDYTCDEDEGTYTLILTIQGSISDYLVEVLFPEEQAAVTVPQGVIGLGPFSFETPNYSVRITQLNTGGSRIIDGVVFDCVTLPIELVSFEGETLQDGNLLKWVTASEVNNDFFSLQRSLEGTNFDKVHTVDGAGTSTTVNSYSYMDRDAGAGIQYYRLQQTDFDGNSTTSNVIALQRGEIDGGFDIISVKPLGNYQNTTVDFQVPAIGKVTAKIFDVSARLLHTTSMEASEGVNTLQLNMSNYLEGIYLLQLQHGDDLRTVKILR